MKRFGLAELTAWTFYMLATLTSLIFMAPIFHIFVNLLGLALLILALIPFGVGFVNFVITYVNLGSYKRGRRNRKFNLAISVAVTVFILVVFVMCLVAQVPAAITAFILIIFELSLATFLSCCFARG